jgi:hypothetical protein
VDSTRKVLLALGRLSSQAWLEWRAEEAAVRARLQIPRRGERFAYYAATDHCVMAALNAANLPSNFRLYDTTLSRDPIRAANQLQQIAAGTDLAGPIEAEHEAARQAYLHAAAAPPDGREQQLARDLAALPAARRDRVIDLAEQTARRHPDNS